MKVLPPEESAHMILKHVNEGIELARQHKLTAGVN